MNNSNGQFALVSGAALGFVGVALGAFGAHALKPLLIETGRLDTFELAVRYQFYHALALLATGILQRLLPGKLLEYSAICFFTGILFFSGSLFILCFTGLGILGIVTPIGGLLFLLGWTMMILSAAKK